MQTASWKINDFKLGIFACYRKIWTNLMLKDIILKHERGSIMKNAAKNSHLSNQLCGKLRYPKPVWRNWCRLKIKLKLTLLKLNDKPN